VANTLPMIAGVAGYLILLYRVYVMRICRARSIFLAPLILMLACW